MMDFRLVQVAADLLAIRIVSFVPPTNDWRWPPDWSETDDMRPKTALVRSRENLMKSADIWNIKLMAAVLFISRSHVPLTTSFVLIVQAIRWKIYCHFKIIWITQTRRYWFKQQTHCCNLFVCVRLLSVNVLVQATLSFARSGSGLDICWNFYILQEILSLCFLSMFSYPVKKNQVFAACWYFIRRNWKCAEKRQMLIDLH